MGVQEFQIERPPRAGQRLEIKIRSSRSFEDFYLVEGHVLCEDRVAARGTLKIWVQPAAAATTGVFGDGH